MATAKDFINRITQIEGVDCCLLIRNDGKPVFRTTRDMTNYYNLMVTGFKLAAGTLETSGLGNCRHFSFHRKNKKHFHVFTIYHYLLGVEQYPDCHTPEMLERIYQLLERVSKPKPNQSGG